MRKGVYSYGLAVILIFNFAITGCGSSSDILDELGWRWRTDGSPTVYDGDTERRIIDPTTQDPAKIEITFISNDDVDTDLFLHDITFTFHGDGNGPDFDTISNLGYNGLLSGNGGTFTYTLYFMSNTDKQDYLDDLADSGISVDGFSSDYTVDIVANFSYTQDGSNDVKIADYSFFTVAPVPTPTPTPTPTP